MMTPEEKQNARQLILAGVCAIKSEDALLVGASLIMKLRVESEGVSPDGNKPEEPDIDG